MKKVSQLPQTKFRSNVIEIFEPVNPESEHRIYFRDRNGNEVFCHHEDPQVLLDLRQKEDFFMGTYIFIVPDSLIKDLEKRINWPVPKPKLTKQDRKTALHWYAVKGYDLITIAQHFGLTLDEIKSELNNVKR